MRASAASGASGTVPSALWWNACSACSRTCSLNARRSLMTFGVLRAMHRLVDTTRKARISRNHHAL